MKRLLSLPFTLIILALTATGCGPGLAEVSGKILINGKATGDVSVFFKPRTGGEKIQAIMQSDKTYYFQMPSGQKGLPTGEYVVWLGVIPGQDGLPETESLKKTVPKQFWDESSGLSCKVVPGGTTYDIKIDGNTKR